MTDNNNNARRRAVYVLLFCFVGGLAAWAQQPVSIISDTSASNTALLAIQTAVEASYNALDEIRTALSEDAIYDNPALSTGPQTMLRFDDASVGTVTEGNAVSARGSANGVAYSSIRDAAGNERGANVTAGNALLTMPDLCGSDSVTSAVIDNAGAAANTQIVALSGSTVVYVCGFNFMSAGTTNVRLVTGTGTACATTETGKTALYPLLAQTGIAVANGGGIQFKSAAGQAVCVESSAAVQVSGLLTYVQR
jgi:hypothetical protein